MTVTLQDLPQNTPDGVALGDATATATINDNDPLTVTVTGDQRVREGLPATYKVVLKEGSGSTPVEVDYTVSGTATVGIDYEEAPEGTLTFPIEDDI